MSGEERNRYKGDAQYNEIERKKLEKQAEAKRKRGRKEEVLLSSAVGQRLPQEPGPMTLTTRPIFSYAFRSHDGHLILEILKNGKPFFEDLPGAARHFSFGPSKARMMVSFMSVIEDFVHSNGHLPGAEQNPKVISRKGAHLTWHAGFSRAGAFVDRPYLELSQRAARIGFGLQKATALVEYEVQLKKLAALR